MEYTSPTVGLIFYPDDYICFLENLADYINRPLKFVPTSKHKSAKGLLEKKPYPIGVLADEVEIHFVHYKSEYEANEKWVRRAKRLNFAKLFFMFSDKFEEKGEFKEEYLVRYTKLPYEHKVFFSSKPRDPSDTVVYVQDFKNAEQVGNMLLHREYEKYFDVVTWLNGKKNFKK